MHWLYKITLKYIFCSEMQPEWNKYIFFLFKMYRIWGWSDKTMSSVLAFACTILGIPDDLLCLPGVSSECRKQGVTSGYHQLSPKTIKNK